MGPGCILLTQKLPVNRTENCQFPFRSHCGKVGLRGGVVCQVNESLRVPIHFQHMGNILLFVCCFCCGRTVHQCHARQLRCGQQLPCVRGGYTNQNGGTCHCEKTYGRDGPIWLKLDVKKGRNPLVVLYAIQMSVHIFNFVLWNPGTHTTSTYLFQKRMKRRLSVTNLSLESSLLTFRLHY